MAQSQALTPQTMFAARCFNTMRPVSGPKAITQVLNFNTNGLVQTVDFLDAINDGKIEWISTIFIDTSQMTPGATGQVSVAIGGSQQVITVPGGTQGYYPVVCPNPALMQVTGNVTGTGIAVLIFLNIPLPAAQWTS